MDILFLRPKLKSSNLDTYVIRIAIYKAITSNLNNLSGKMLDVGCGKKPYKDYILKNSDVTEYIGLDIETALEYDAKIKPDATWNGITMSFESESFDCAMATEVLEHCFEPEIVLKEIHRVLKPGGICFFTVPFLWNLHETPHDAYRYTPFALEKHLKNSGFTSIEIKATGGWHAAMAQMLGLWIKRSPISSRKRKVLSYFGLRIIPYLLKIDNSKNVKFKEGQMITGLFGFVKKT